MGFQAYSFTRHSSRLISFLPIVYRPCCERLGHHSKAEVIGNWGSMSTSASNQKSNAALTFIVELYYTLFLIVLNVRYRPYSLPASISAFNIKSRHHGNINCHDVSRPFVTKTL